MARGRSDWTGISSLSVRRPPPEAPAPARCAAAVPNLTLRRAGPCISCIAFRVPTSSVRPDSPLIRCANLTKHQRITSGVPTPCRAISIQRYTVRQAFRSTEACPCQTKPYQVRYDCMSTACLGLPAPLLFSSVDPEMGLTIGSPQPRAAGASLHHRTTAHPSRSSNLSECFQRDAECG